MHFVIIIYFLGITVIRGELTTIYFSIIFFHPFTFLLLCSLSAVSNSSIFFHSFPTLSRLLLMQSPLQFQCSSPPFPPHIQASGLCQFIISHLFHMTSPCTSHQFVLRTFLRSNLHSHFIHFLLSALLIPMIILTRLLSTNLDLLLFLC